jgi:lysine-specific demethylase 8
MRALLVLCGLVLLSSSDAASDVPAGHLKPLGGHRPPEGEVDVIDGFPSPLEFYDKYIVGSKPVLMRGAAKGMKAFSLWTDEYLSSNFGKEWVEVEEGKKENRDLSMWTDSFGGFLRKYQGKDSTDKHRGNFYSVSAMPIPQRKDYELPRMVNCPAYYSNRMGGMRQINHWFSSGGTSSVLHKDQFENLNCLFDGSKDMVFFHRNYSEEDLHWDYTDNHHHSKADCSSVDLIKYPNIKNLKWWKAHMDRGDCLFIPRGWYHHVKSNPGENKRNYATNLWWEMDTRTPQTRKAVEACPNPGVQAGPKTANDIKFSREQFPVPPGQQEQDGPEGDEDDDGDGPPGRPEL